MALPDNFGLIYPAMFEGKSHISISGLGCGQPHIGNGWAKTDEAGPIS
jgi:hypothetical protein